MPDPVAKNRPGDALTIGLLRQFNRRWFLKGAGAAILSAMPIIGFALTASARPTCPPDSEGICNNCWSGCVTGGRRCACDCASCNCEPPSAFAACSWIQFGSQCFFNCDCIAC